ncbi:MAG: SPOR domain-containing protein [Pseudomonadota bacterium]
MADFAEIDGVEAGYDAAPGALAVLAGWTGALTSVALIAGLGVWGYQLAMRDVTGVPVVRALEGPMRVQPEDPGGSQAAHQGLAVNSVAAQGAAEAPADRLILAPPPLDLTAEDLPRPALGAPTAPPSQDTTLNIQALADQLASGATPLELAADQSPITDVEPTAGIIPVDVAGVARSPLPALRPNQDVTAVAIASQVALSVGRPAAEVDPGSVPAGTRLVQFGAYDSPEVARAQWQDLQSKFNDFMQGKQRIVQEAVSGGKTFYRLRAMGFADINDARRFCAALVAERQACIPVVVR